MCQRRAGGLVWELIENINKGQFSGNLVGLFSIAGGEKYRKMSFCGATEQPGYGLHASHRLGTLRRKSG